MAEPILALRDCAIHYGHVQAVKGIDLEIREGEITALVGANGAGKTTTLLGISHIQKLARGSIHFNGRNITRLPPHEIVRLGLVHVPEGREILKYLTVADNLALGAYTRRDKQEIAADLAWVYKLFPVLKDRASGMAGNLSGGEQQMLAIARALMARPKLLLLDEPSMGLAPVLVQEIFRVLTEINQTGLTILLVEQNVRQALQISSHGFVLETGKIVLADTSAQLLGHPRVIEAYLGR